MMDEKRKIDDKVPFFQIENTHIKKNVLVIQEQIQAKRSTLDTNESGCLKGGGREAQDGVGIKEVRKRAENSHGLKSAMYSALCN